MIALFYIIAGIALVAFLICKVFTKSNKQKEKNEMDSAE